MIGTVLAGRYLVEAEIGSGGMGAVYRATDLRTGGQVAVKQPHRWLDKDSNFFARLRREAEIAASLTNPRIVRVIDFDTWEGHPFLVMEFVPGPTLADILAERGTIEWREAAWIGMEVARAMEAAHQRGIVHRDLKPQNIKVVETDVKVLDFGIARAEGSAALTSASVFVGTPDYVAPERMGVPLDPSAPATDPAAPAGDIRSDIYSLGIILFEMLTGAPPFAGLSPWQVLRAHESMPPPPLPDSVPMALQAVVARCLAKRPEWRYQAPRELVAALAATLSETGAIRVSDTPAAAPAPPAAPPPTGSYSDAVASRETSSPTAEAPAVPRTAARGTAVLPFVAGGVLLLAVGGTVFALSRGGDSGTAVTTPAPTTARTTTGGAATSAPVTAAPAGSTIRITRVAVFASNATNTAGPGVTELQAGSGARVCYDYANAQENDSLTVVLLLSGREVGSSTPFPAPPSGQRCEDVRAGLTAGAYVAQVRDKAGRTLGEKRFTVK